MTAVAELCAEICAEILAEGVAESAAERVCEAILSNPELIIEAAETTADAHEGAMEVKKSVRNLQESLDPSTLTTILSDPNTVDMIVS